MSSKKKNKADETEMKNEQEQKAGKAVVEEAEIEESKEKEAADQAQQEIAELKDKILRQMAEFDNYRKRTTKEKTDIYVDVKAKCAAELLPMIDNFERALECPCEDESFKKGIDMIFHQFRQILTSMGVEEIEALGVEFDPQVHHAVSQVEDENFGENIVSQVYQKGYRIGDKVIRPAMVVVANS